ncbi:hypothetical protein B9N43_08480 [Denitratisoma sp. DHT3]|uniref:enoyl-CoA hydratase/isomerase family protein n=1 Tax=Denitratisoma sp. DHT3 TaxID=1981880 RepID=UPI001198784A|nr:enoyl-CoA hydratase-related protein [Denitratisoma sp. DHT3]QDX81274.1 hypothetical protein B9N43_08480 [Denitratisoma sp. DHT3]
MVHEQIIVERRGRVGVITLNRPERLNALTLQLIDELYAAFDDFNADPGIGAIVLTGAGRAFCAGLDVADWESAPADAKAKAPDGSNQLRWMRTMQTSKPVVVAVNGLAVGGGLTMILSCDIRIASDQAQFQERHVRMGLAPDLGSSRLLAQIVGLSHALRLQLTARRIEAREAERIGLVTEVVPHAQLLDAALALAGEIAAHPPSALRACKQLVWDNLCETDGAAVVRRECEVEERLLRGPDFREATQAFLEKRPPRFDA